MSSGTQEHWKHPLVWGLALGVAVSVAIQILTWLGLGLTHWTWISAWLLAAIFGALATRALQRRLGRRPGFFFAAAVLAAMILVARLVEQTYMWVYINFVDPAWVETVAEVWTAQLQEAGETEENIGRQIADFRNRWRTGYVFTLGILSFSLPPFVLALATATAAVLRPWRRRVSQKSF